MVFPPPPRPLPEALWGDHWQFMAIAAQDLGLAFDRPMRYRFLPSDLDPLALGLAADLPIPGVALYGGRQSKALGQWLTEQSPHYVTFVPQDPERSGGLVLHTHSGDRWILATFEEEDGAQAGSVFTQRQRQAKGLHFLWVQPDQTGVTTTGVWLWQHPDFAV